MKILLAEDDIHISMIMRLCLEKMGGHEVTTVEDGESAFVSALSHAFDLVILDGMMPKKPGLQVARELREKGFATPIIFLSAKNDEQGYLTYGTGFIAKPFEPTAICARIDEILSNPNAAKQRGAS